MSRETGEQLTGTLGAFGLSEEDESTYLVLLSLPSATRAELARRGGASPTQLAASLVRLQARGLARRLPGRPARYVAAPPDAAIEALVHDHELQLQRVRAATGELLVRYRAGRLTLDPANLVEVIVGQEAIAQRFRELQAAASAARTRLPSRESLSTGSLLKTKRTWRSAIAPPQPRIGVAATFCSSRRSETSPQSSPSAATSSSSDQAPAGRTTGRPSSWRSVSSRRR